MLPIASALTSHASFTGSGRLPERPVDGLIEALSAHGKYFSGTKLPFTAEGNLEGGVFSVTGDLTSQYLSGLFMALPLLPEGSSVKLATKLHSTSYVSLTTDVMSRFGITVEGSGSGLVASGRSGYVSPGQLGVTGDWSGAASLLTAGLVRKGNSVSYTGLDLYSSQSDTVMISLFNMMHGTLLLGREITAKYCSLTGADIDIDNAPDLFPSLAVAASAADGISRFTNISRLRLKESDRVTTTVNMINSIGGKAEICGDSVIIKGSPLTGGIADPCGDHRIAMAAAAASTLCSEPVIIKGFECTNKSYPDFLRDFRAIGGIADVI